MARIWALARHQRQTPFKKALLYARSLDLKSQVQWHEWSKSGARPGNISCRPDGVYKHDGWQGYGHWLGTGNVKYGSKNFLPFKKALLYARSLDLKGKVQWEEWSQSGARPENIPSNPSVV